MWLTCQANREEGVDENCCIFETHLLDIDGQGLVPRGLQHGRGQL